MDKARSAAASGVSFRVALACDLAEVRPATLAVRAFLEQQELPEGEVSACELALVEACNNAVQYAHEDAQLEPVEISVVYSGSKVEVRVTDHTKGFDWPQKSKLPPLENERGRGIYFIQALMDDASYHRGKDENCLVMRKLLAGSAWHAVSQKSAPQTSEETQSGLHSEILAAILRSGMESGGGLPHSMTLREEASAQTSEGLGVRESSAAFTKQDLTAFADNVARELVSLTEQRLENRELEIAEDIQRSLLPRTLPEIPGFSIAGYCKCARPIGGDFYDVVPLSDGSVLLVIADVMGNGVPSALFAAELHSLARVMPEWVSKPSELLRRINELMFEELSAVDMFITAQLVFFDPKHLQARIASAGHCPALLTNPGQPIRQIAPEGMPVGVMRDVQFHDEVIDLTPQSRLLLFTDGVTDTQNVAGERFGLERLFGWLGTLPESPTNAEHEKFQLASELVRFQGAASLSDDQTFLLLCGGASASLSSLGERAGVRGLSATSGITL